MLTFDYELWGDGSGDVFELMINPTNEVLEICRAHDVKITFFFEVVEYLRLKEAWDSGNTMGYSSNPIEAIETQIQKVALDGHDIQLHIHPQWVKSHYEEGGWKVDLSNWRLGDFSTDEMDIKGLLAWSKFELEKLIREVIPDYRSSILRAGGYNVEPFKELHQAMCELGLEADSSVYPGGFENGTLSRFDYRNATLAKDFWWTRADDITDCGVENGQIMEIPIMAFPQRRIWKLLNKDRLRSILTKSGGKPQSVASEKLTQGGLLQKMRFVWGKEALTWDFCLFSKPLHARFFKEIERKMSDSRNTFVLVGHPKSFISRNSLESLISLAERSKFEYSYKTLFEVYEGFRG